MSNAHTVNETLIPNKPYSLMRDFVAGGADQLLGPRAGRHPSVPANTLPEFIALAKAQPGKLNYASSGPGTPYHMAGELFKSMAGVDIVHVPYKGSSGARTDVLGGQVEMMFDAVTTMNEQAKAGKVRALAHQRQDALRRDARTCPTMSEAGVPGYEAVIWLGVMAPKGTPPAIVNRAQRRDRERSRTGPEVRAEWAKQGASAMTMTPDEFGRYVADDIAKWEKVIKVSGAKPDR